MTYTTNIYGLFDPRDGHVKYIGKADNLKRRYQHHAYTREKTLKGNWIESLRANGLMPQMEVLDRVPSLDWQFWEMHYISLYKSWGFLLKNGDNGGLQKGRMTREVKDKFHAKNKGKKLSPKQIEILREKMIGEKNPMKNPETAKKVSQKLDYAANAIKAKQTAMANGVYVASSIRMRYNNPMKNDLTAKKVAATQKSNNQHEFLRQRMRGPDNPGKKQMKPISQYSMNGEFIKNWSCCAEAAKEMKKSSPNIYRACIGYTKHAYGFVWKYNNKKLEQCV